MSTPTTPARRTDPLTAWRRSAAPFTAEVEAVADWDAPSPCEGWSARDVLAHVIDTEQEFLTRVGLAPEGREVRFDAQELSLLDASVDSWGEHAYAPGVFSSPLEVPERADAQTRVLARMGRRGSTAGTAHLSDRAPRGPRV